METRQRIERSQLNFSTLDHVSNLIVFNENEFLFKVRKYIIHYIVSILTKKYKCVFNHLALKNEKQILKRKCLAYFEHQALSSSSNISIQAKLSARIVGSWSVTYFRGLPTPNRDFDVANKDHDNLV